MNSTTDDLDMEESANRETIHAPANDFAMREAARLFGSLRTRAAFIIGGALFARLDLVDSNGVES